MVRLEEEQIPCLHCYIGEAINAWMADMGMVGQEMTQDKIDHVLDALGLVTGEFGAKTIETRNKDCVREFFTYATKAIIRGYNETGEALNAQAVLPCGNKEVPTVTAEPGELVIDTIPDPETKFRH